MFGKQVNDFRIVDYDRLFTLNLSATQELNKMLEEEKAKNQKLEIESTKKIAELAKGLNTLKRKIIKCWTK